MGLLRTLFLVAVVGIASSGVALAQAAVGSITAGSGEIVVIGAGGNETPGTVGTEIHQYDQIFVGEGSEATVTFVDETVLSLGAESSLTVDELVYDPAGQDNSALFTLAGGLMGLVSGDILKSGDMTVTTPVSTIGIRGTGVLIDTGTVVRRLPGGTLAVQTTTDTGEVVSLVLSPDGTVGTVTVVNQADGSLTQLSAFGDTVTTATVGGGAVQVRSTLTPAQINATFGPVVRALQNAMGLDLTDPANAAEAEALQEALQEVLDTIEENPSQDASPD